MKRSVVVSAALAGAMVFSCLTGFDSAATAEDVFQKYVEASKETKQATMDVTYNASAALNVETYGSFDMALSGSLKEGITMDPLQLYMNGNITGSAMGTTADYTMEMYMVPEDDGSESIYVGMTDNSASGDSTEGSTESGTTWEHQSISAEDMNSFKALMDNTEFYSSQSDKFTLASEPVTVNGKECYELAADFSWADIKELTGSYLNSIAEKTGSDDASSDLADLQSELSQVDPYLGGLVLHTAIDIGTDDYKAYAIHLDLNSSDWSAINEILPSLLGLTDDEGKAPSASLTVSDLSMDGTYDYDSAVSFTVPQEALDSAVTSSSEAFSEAEGLLSSQSESAAG